MQMRRFIRLTNASSQKRKNLNLADATPRGLHLHLSALLYPDDSGDEGGDYSGAMDGAGSSDGLRRKKRFDLSNQINPRSFIQRPAPSQNLLYRYCVKQSKNDRWFR